jgi:hypothetical protein
MKTGAAFSVNSGQKIFFTPLRYTVKYNAEAGAAPRFKYNIRYRNSYFKKKQKKTYPLLLPAKTIILLGSTVSAAVAFLPTQTLNHIRRIP